MLSSRGAWDTDEGVFVSLDVFDEAGRYVRRVHLVMDGDRTKDGMFFAGGRFYRVVDLFGAVMAKVGGDDSLEIDEDSQPIQIVAYKLDSADAGVQ